MFHSRLSLVCCLLGALLIRPAAPADTGWRSLQTPHCRILSQLPETETREWASAFEQFYAAAHTVLVIDDTALGPLTLVIFDEWSFGRYKPRGTDGKVRKGVAGFCDGSCHGAYIAFAKRPDPYETRHVLFHEATHWLLGGSRTQVPLWFHEGIAETLATFSPGPEFGTLGLVDNFAIDLLQEKPWVPWEKILQTYYYDPLYRGDPELVELFYAQSWLCVHRLLFRKSADGVAALNRHTQARLNGANPREAFRIAIERDFGLFEQKLNNYARRERISPRRIPCPPEAKVTTPYAPADRLEVETMLAELAIGSRRFEVANKHMAQVRKLAPGAPIVLELQTVYEIERDQKDAAYATAKQAIAAGATDAGLFTFIGDRDLANAKLGTLDDAELRRLAEPFLRALAASPRESDAYNGYARLATRLQTPNEDDAHLLKSGSEYFPDKPWPFVGLAAIRFRQNNLAEAKELLGLALSRLEVAAREKPADSDDIATPTTLGPKGAHIETLVAGDRITEAITEFEALLEIPIPKD